MQHNKTDKVNTLDGFVRLEDGDCKRSPPQKKIVNLSDPQLRTKESKASHG